MNISLILLFVFLINVSLTLFVLVMMWRFKGKIKSQQDIIANLNADLSALCTGATGVSGHLSRVDDQIRQLSLRHDESKMDKNSGRAYEKAIKMIKKGVNRADVMSVCGIVKTEADLLMQLHSRPSGH